MNHMDQERIDRTWMMGAEWVKTFSADPSTKVGCLVVKSNKLVASGWNHLPTGTSQSMDILNNRVEKWRRIIHAEVDAILGAGRATTGATLYTTYPPCSRCAGMIIEARFNRIVLPRDIPDFDEVMRETEGFGWASAQEMFAEAHVIVSRC